MIDSYAPFEALQICEPIFDDETLRAKRRGVFAFRAGVVSVYGGRGVGVGRQCDGAPTSKHHESRAWDWGPVLPEALEVWKDDARRLIAELLDDGPEGAHQKARQLGLRTIIFDGQEFNAADEFAPTPIASHKEQHRTHVHFGFSWAGARGKTSGYDGEGGGSALVPLLVTAAILSAALILSRRARG